MIFTTPIFPIYQGYLGQVSVFKYNSSSHLAETGHALSLHGTSFLNAEFKVGFDAWDLVLGNGLPHYLRKSTFHNTSKPCAMTEKFKNKYRIPSARKQSWDYSNPSSYFITICTKDRTHYFGEIENETMHLSHVGIVVDVLWHEIKNHVPNISLDAFVVMPNHLHGILTILPDPVETGHALSPIDQTALTSHPKPTPNTELKPLIHPRQRNPGKRTVSTIMGSYKGAITKHCNRLNLEFDWQRLFHDHIIRNQTEYDFIKNYIDNNVQNWKEDRFYNPKT
jgi:REP element-mobilizing transposase RayT